MWTFHAVEGDVYYLTTEIGGQIKFLSVTASGLSLTEKYDAATCNVTVIPGTGSYSGKLKLVGSDGSVVRMHENSATNGFGTTTAAENANDWMNLAVKSNLDDDDFVSYTAHKVSVSDTESVSDGKQIIIYTRTWNDTKKQYEFYAIDHDGSLLRIYENGTELSWVGTQVNTALWNFTEYHNSDGTPNYYYELQNNYSGKYLAPNVKSGQVLSGNTIGLNLNGRRYEEYATTILAWDDPSYQYSGFKVDNGRLVPCSMSEAEDFYFAVVEPTGEEVQLTTVDTVDNSAFGITMKMIDYNGTKTNNGIFSDQRPFSLQPAVVVQGIRHHHVAGDIRFEVNQGKALPIQFERVTWEFLRLRDRNSAAGIIASVFISGETLAAGTGILIHIHRYRISGIISDRCAYDVSTGAVVSCNSQQSGCRFVIGQPDVADIVAIIRKVYILLCSTVRVRIGIDVIRILAFRLLKIKQTCLRPVLRFAEAVWSIGDVEVIGDIS